MLFYMLWVRLAFVVNINEAWQYPLRVSLEASIRDG